MLRRHLDFDRSLFCFKDSSVWIEEGYFYFLIFWVIRVCIQGVCGAHAVVVDDDGVVDDAVLRPSLHMD